MQSKATFCLAALLAAGAANATHAPADTGVARTAELANYDAQFNSSAWNQHFRLTTIQQQLRAQRAALLQSAPRNGFPSQIDDRSSTPRVLWAGNDHKPAAVGALKDVKVIAEARARDFLKRRAVQLGISASIVDQAVLVDAQAPKHGPTIVRFKQMHNGVEVFNHTLNVAMDRAGQLVAISGGFAADIDAETSARLPHAISAATALSRAFENLGGAAGTSFSSKGKQGEYTLFQLPSSSGDLELVREPRTKSVYYSLGNQMIPAYYLELWAESRTSDLQREYGYVVSAVDGSVLFRMNQRQYDAYSYRVFADDSGNNQPFDGPIGNSYTPYHGTDIEANQERVSATANLITLDYAPSLSTADPWLASGATVTSGNNVDAYLDLARPDGFQARRGDLQPTVTGANTFDFPITADADPTGSDARNAAVVNLFYLNNWLHDFWYDHGFTETDGNAQLSNYDRGGVEGDEIQAQGQDYSGTNNANMSTPADGGSPRMQMYLWDGPISGAVDVSIGGADPLSLVFGVAAFGPSVYDIPATALALVDDGTDPVTDACTAIQNTTDIAGKIAVIDRGSCAFQDKAAAAEAAGAVAVIVVDNTEEAPFTMGANSGSPTVTIPAVLIKLSDGTTIKDALANSTVVTAALNRVATPAEDGTLDNQIISHEFFHYVSNRLVNNGSGLGNAQGGGMGEGWSDFDTMMTTVREEDVGFDGNASYGAAYPTGFYAYVVTPSYYFGIRRTPYSTDFSIDPLTFQHITNGVALPTTAPIAFGANGASNAEVHNSGEIWTNMLWEGYASMLSSGYYSFDEARSRMQDYVIGGLKMTPAQPTFTEARDGVIAAAAASSCVDANLISRAFAKRGMGADAVAPDSASTDNSGVVEDYTAAVINCPPVADAGADQEALTGILVTLDGSGSSDFNEDELTYAWTQTSGPTATLSDAAAAKPTFTPTEAGTYVFMLTVTDPSGDTSTDEVTITVAADAAPVANAGPDQSLQSGTKVTLTGAGSTDADGDTLTYAWTQTSGTAVVLSSASAVMPTFTPTAAGTYVFQLKVTDPSGASSTDSVTITVTAAPGGGDDGGGAFGGASLLALLGLGALRQRRGRSRK